MIRNPLFNKIRKSKYSLIILFVLIIFGCNKKEERPNLQNINKLNSKVEKNIVEIVVLSDSVFQKELVNSGKLRAQNKSKIRFRTSGCVKEVFVKNGDFVKVGSPIACLENYEQLQAYNQASINLENAKYDLEEYLIGRGYRLEDSLEIPNNLMELAINRSGYKKVCNDYSIAKFKLEQTTLCAPFSGVIANLDTKDYENTNSKELCLLINDSVFEVEFSVLESEMINIELGKSVKIIPFSKKKTLKGEIIEINPFISESGLIKVKANVKNTCNLMEGMNVTVYVETKVNNQLVVPKSAVLQRDNQQVVFRYVNGVAWWTYVNTLYENSTSYALEAVSGKNSTLESGDTVIISGNLNLAHESEVQINN